MLIRKPALLKYSDITPPLEYRNRREFLAQAAAIAVLAAAGCAAPAPVGAAEEKKRRGEKLAGVIPGAYKVNEKLNSFEEITSYNNFYEFGTDKSDPARYAHTLRPRPWTVKVEGLVKKPRTIDLDEILKIAPLEERVYRFRCVEAWSMVIPWVGFPLSALLGKLDVLPGAKYVEFVTLLDPAQFPAQKRRSLDWPYREGLRLDEAMHPLALMAVGLYGETLPSQNGAPLRLVVPWKYGFKSIKSIVTIRLRADRPPTTWNDMAPGEYGFYSNVNPAVDHPRWSQASERRIGEFSRRKTLPFNGYADEVSGLYAGLDLKKEF